jgi:hypothetical protein
MTKSDSLVLTVCDAARSAGNVQLAERLLTRRFGAAADGRAGAGERAPAARQGRRLEAIERLCGTIDGSIARVSAMRGSSPSAACRWASGCAASVTSPTASLWCALRRATIAVIADCAS